MNAALADLVRLLALERIEENLFRGGSQDLGWGAIFGGQVLGQALSAAAQTVPPERPVHSLHAYFLRQGDAERPVVYDVDRIRDGRSFTTRRVVAIQAGRAIFNMSASFQVVEDGLSHQDPMPEVPMPETLASERDRRLEVAERFSEKLRARLDAERPIEARVVGDWDVTDPVAAPPDRSVWFRATDRLPDDPALHRYLLAYASDFHFLITSLQPHGRSWMTPGMQLATIDHAMWFHAPLRMDDWVLHTVHSPHAGGARGLVRGQFYDRSGRLVASTAQEGLIRQWTA